MLRRPYYFALSIVVLFVLIILSLPTSFAGHLKVALSGFFLPLFGLSNSAHVIANTIGDSLTTREVLITEVNQLKRENQQLRAQSVQYAQVLDENNRLRQAVGWQQQVPWKLKLGRVILRDPANWWRAIQINLGSRDGVVTNMPVLTQDGLIGRVAQVSLGRSQVLLIGDPKCQVHAMIKETRATGILSASSSGISNPSLASLKFLNKSSIEPGNTVITSGMSDIFPPGILIGHVVDSESVGFGLYEEAQVKLSSDLARLEEVWVLFP